MTNQSNFLKTCLANKLLQKKQISDPEKLNESIRSANIDLNPHQVDAAIFAFKSPLSRGAILADEVGLGKTIEAGLIINQLWAEGRRKMLILVPASLRTQWQDEVRQHFDLESTVIDGPTFNKLVRSKQKTNPLKEDGIYISSHNFAYGRDVVCKEVPWDLIVIDEAHRLRNVYRKGNKTAKRIREALKGRPKILLTATPIQNNLMELYGLVSFLDEKYLGTDYSFKTIYSNPVARQKNYTPLKDLQRRLMGTYDEGTDQFQGGVLTRTLRQQVQSQGLVHFTKRFCVTEDFDPNNDEVELYDSVSEYLSRPYLASTRATQRNMMELVYRKILASSSFAIAGTLARVSNFLSKRLQQEYIFPHEEILKIVSEEQQKFEKAYRKKASGIEIEKHKPEESEMLPGFEDLELDPEKYQEEIQDADDLGEDEQFDDEAKKYEKKEAHHEFTLEEVIAELRDVLGYYFLASSIQKNQKSQALLKILKKIWKHADKMKWPKKAVIFTESRRTQDHLEKLLESQEYNLILFNGTNASKKAKETLEEWKSKFPEDAAKGNRSINIRKALIWKFKTMDSGILITTESGAEGINLQFSNIVVNYDLPWNPQRVEQRIGRCHRYGQKLDVLVVNFLNRQNYADQRVYELLKEKIQLFGNLFEFSDKILGTEAKADDGYYVREIALAGLGAGLDFERRVLDIYRKCRTKKQIEEESKQLQLELADIIEEKMDDAQKKVIQHFDEDVHRKLKIRKKHLQKALSRYDKELKRFVQNAFQELNIEENSFQYHGQRYFFGKLSNEEREATQMKPAHTRLDFIRTALENASEDSGEWHIEFQHPETNARKILGEHIGKEGQLTVDIINCSRKTINGDAEEFHRMVYSILVKNEDGWKSIASSLGERILDLDIVSERNDSSRLRDELEDLSTKNVRNTQQKILEENERFVDLERDHIRQFAKESLMRHEADMKKIKDEIDTLENQLKASKTMGFHERQEVRDQIDKKQKQYFKAQEKYIRAEREQFMVRDKQVEQLKDRLQLKFDTRRIASVKFTILN